MYNIQTRFFSREFRILSSLLLSFSRYAVMRELCLSSQIFICLRVPRFFDFPSCSPRQLFHFGAFVLTSLVHCTKVLLYFNCKMNVCVWEIHSSYKFSSFISFWSVSACVPEAFALSTSLFFFVGDDFMVTTIIHLSWFVLTLCPD